MLDYEIASHERHDHFVQCVTAAGLVWGLKSPDGWCVSLSTKDATEGQEIMPFWSDRAYAKQCAKDDWATYEPTAIPLNDFMRRWLPGMAQDGVLVGTNWNAHLIGMEIEPRELSEELNKALQTRA